MRYSIWTAVSSEAQASSDKVSLSEQQSKCRAAGFAKGWREVTGPYIVPGESRTRWINLRDAEDAIPALKEMLNAAQRGEFDVLVLYDYSRLRELLDPVSRTLSAYKVQLYSISQPVEPQDPETFDLYATDTSNAVQFVSALTSRAEINALRRRYRIGVPRRVGKGLHTVGILPYAYRKPPGRELDHNVVPILEPEKAAALIKAKDLLLSGQSVPQVTAWLNTTGLRPHRVQKWNVGTVRKMFINPYYAGLVQHGAIRRTRDPRNGKYKDRIITDKSLIIKGRGQHEPLWDESTYHAILAEFKRRARHFKGHHTHRLSRLLYCGLCDQPLHVIYYSNACYDDDHRAWYCRTVQHKWHMHIRDSLALDALASQLTHDLGRLDQLTLPEPEDRSGILSKALTDLLVRRERLTDALEAGNLNPVTYGERVKSIEGRLSEVKADLDQAERNADNRKGRRTAFEELAAIIDSVPEYIRHAPAQSVNAQLHRLIDKIMVFDGGELKIIYR